MTETKSDVSTGSALPKRDADHTALMSQMRSDKTTVREAADLETDRKSALNEGVEIEEKAPEPEKKATPAPEDDDLEGLTPVDFKGQKVVPVAELVKLRKARKADKEAHEKFVNDANERLTKLLEKQMGGDPEPEKKTDPQPEQNPYNFDTHPFEHLNWKADQANKRAESAEKRFTDFEGKTAEEKKFHNAVASYQSGHTAFVKKDPTYQDAYEKLITSWVGMGKAAGMNDQQAVQQAQSMEWNIIQMAMQAGVNPQERLLSVAKASGWTPTKQTETERKPDVNILREAREISGSLSEASGGAAPEMDIKAIVGMPMDQFEVWIADPKNKAKWKAMKQGRH